MKNKKLILAVVAAVVVVALALGLYFATRPATSAGAKAFTVEVVHADGSSKEFKYNTDEEFLGTVLVSEGLVSGETGEWGLMIDTVDGEQAIWAESGAYWALYIGDEYAQTGVDSTPVNDGDVFRLVYTIG